MVLGRAHGVRLKVRLHAEVDSVSFRPFIHLSLAVVRGLAAVSAWKVLEGGYGEVSGGANTTRTGDLLCDQRWNLKMDFYIHLERRGRPAQKKPFC